MLSDMGLACPISYNNALEGIASSVVSSRQKQVRTLDVSLSFLLHTGFKNEIVEKARNFALTVSQGLLSVSPPALQ